MSLFERKGLDHRRTRIISLGVNERSGEEENLCNGVFGR